MKRPTTDDKKRALGNLRPGTGRAAPNLTRGRPKMPPSLSRGARAVWRRTVARMVEAGTVSALHTDCLVLYCETWATFEADPAAAKPSMVAQLRMLQGELGLTPATRARVPVLDSPAPEPPAPTGKNVLTMSDLLRESRERREAAKGEPT